MQVLMEFLATFCCAIFTGAAVYINAVEHPARMSCGTKIALAEWAPSYKRATVMQASLAVLGFVFSIIASDKWSNNANTSRGNAWAAFSAGRYVLAQDLTPSLFCYKCIQAYPCGLAWHAGGQVFTSPIANS